MNSEWDRRMNRGEFIGNIQHNTGLNILLILSGACHNTAKMIVSSLDKRMQRCQNSHQSIKEKVRRLKEIGILE